MIEDEIKEWHHYGICFGLYPEKLENRKRSCRVCELLIKGIWAVQVQ